MGGCGRHPLGERRWLMEPSEQKQASRVGGRTRCLCVIVQTWTLATAQELDPWCCLAP